MVNKSEEREMGAEWLIGARILNAGTLNKTR